MLYTKLVIQELQPKNWKTCILVERKNQAAKTKNSRKYKKKIENNLKLKTAKLSSQLSADVNQGNTQTRTRIRIETATVAFFAMADIAYTPSEPSQVSRRQPSVQTGSKSWQILMQPVAMAKNIRQRGTDS